MTITGRLSARERFRQLLLPPRPFVMNTMEMIDAPLRRWNFIHRRTRVCHASGVDVVVDAHDLPWAAVSSYVSSATLSLST